jgi:membrane-associated HD superfamily phosphohydrolase
MNTITEQEKNQNYNSIKIAIWLYFLLWIFEGALRKWILPSLATPLLIVRDPLAIYIIIKAFNLKINFRNPYVVLSTIFTLLGLAITLTFGHGNLFVGLYGARIMLLHFPLIFIIGAVFTKEDIVKMGRVMLVINILVTLIVYFQFISPQSAFINIGIGGEGSAGFSGSMGYFRPSGTFSFTTGLSSFYILVSVFVFYFWLSKEL